MIILIAGIQKYEQKMKSQQSVRLNFSKTKSLPQIQDTPHLIHNTSKLSMAVSLNREYAKDLLSKIKLTEGKKRHIRNERLLKLMSNPKLDHSLTVTGIDFIHHITCLKSNLDWVSDRNDLLLATLTGTSLCHISDLYTSFLLSNELHTVNSDNELIYIDSGKNIKSKSTKILKNVNYLHIWEPRCVY